MLTKKNKLKAPRNTNKEQKRLARALRLEADLIERLKRLRQTRIFRNNQFVVAIETSEGKLPRVAPRKDNNRKKNAESRVAIATQPAATSKRQKRSSMIYKSLEDACERFESYCCECGKKMKVHAHGIGYPIREEVVSAACWNEVCLHRGTEVRYSGAQLQGQNQPELIVNAKKELGILLELPIPTRMSI